MNDKGVEESVIMKIFLILILNDEPFIVHQMGRVERAVWEERKTLSGQ